MGVLPGLCPLGRTAKGELITVRPLFPNEPLGHYLKFCLGGERASSQQVRRVPQTSGRLVAVPPGHNLRRGFPI